MSQIESDVIPIAKPLIKGEMLCLDETKQTQLAAFLCLISMRVEFLGRMRAIPPAHRCYIKDHQQPPAGWTIWIARYAGERPDEDWSRFCGMQIESVAKGQVLTPRDKAGADYCNTQVTTMVIGKLCTHIVSSTENVVDGYEGIRLTRIWPLSGFSIDSRFLPTWDDKAVIWLHEALARESTPFPSPSQKQFGASIDR
jgi:hypothetical protein